MLGGPGGYLMSIPNVMEVFRAVIDLAREAERSREWADALRFWSAADLLGTTDPDVPLGHARALAALERPDEARAVLERATARHPTAVWIWHDLGRIAERQEDWIGAERCWRAVLSMEEHVWAYVALANALRGQGNAEAASDVLRQAESRFKDDWVVAAEIARDVEFRADPGTTLKYWVAAGLLNATHPDIIRGHARTLAALERLDEARLVLERATVQHPTAVWIWHDLGRLAERQEDWAGAERCWRAVLSTERHGWAYISLGQALRVQGRLSEAIKVLMECQDSGIILQVPVLEWIGVMFGQLGRMSEAVAFMERLTDQYEGRTDFSVLVHNLRMRQIDERLASSNETEEREIELWVNHLKPQGDRPDDDRDLFMAFESLGGTAAGCDFAAVQDSHGASPLSLLRWSGMELWTLTDALEARFQDFGEMDKIEVDWFPRDPNKLSREYRVRDLIHGAVLHSHVHEHEEDIDTFRNKLSRRMVFLREKLKSDLAEGQKIFVFKLSIRAPMSEEVARISAALGRYGDNNLLVVLDTRDYAFPEPVHLIAPHVWMSSIDFSLEFGPARIAAWRDMCRFAYQIIVSKQAPEAVAA
jgi:tetratricopeptide (TPR) repeat protein